MISAVEAAKRAVHHVTEMTGRDAECVVGAERGGRDGGDGQNGDWCITVEVVETRRIPDSADILAVYLVEIDDEGELLSYRRLRRYARGRTGQG
ncbi:hypothetical protein GCM10010191_64640 [Actinomadura vinacea]|uniref:Gas vesicle protein n=1 Tax=Actinomadura vinacea TaxID=115336 RepID=A0ABN3JUS2_9ACTN